MNSSFLYIAGVLWAIGALVAYYLGCRHLPEMFGVASCIFIIAAITTPERRHKMETTEDKAIRIQMAKDLARLDPDMMTPYELNLAMALVLKKDCRVKEDGTVEIPLDAHRGRWIEFSPMSDSDDLLEVMSNVELVVGNQALFEDEDDCEVITGHHYTAHAFLGGTNADSIESINEAVGITCAKLLKNMLGWSKDWREE